MQLGEPLQEFEWQTDKIILGGGNGARIEVLELAASALDSMGIFPTIDIVTLNEADDKKADKVQKAAQEDYGVIGHSAFTTRIKDGIQIAAFMPVEPVLVRSQLARLPNFNELPYSEKEEGAHDTDFRDMRLLAKELAFNPASTARTMNRVRRHSTMRQFTDQDVFKAGKAIIHAERDTAAEGFGFVEEANALRYLARNHRIYFKILEGRAHNDFMFCPRAIFTESGIFPQEAIDRMNQSAA